MTTNSSANEIAETTGLQEQSAKCSPLELQSKLGSLYETLSRVQNEHGVYPFNDYHQYRNYCSQRLSRIRHNPLVKSYLLHNHKYHSVLGDVNTANSAPSTAASANPRSQQPSRRKHAYYSRRSVYDNLSAICSDANQTAPFIWNIFFQAERAWAQACALLQPGANRKSRHGHVQRRFNKAHHWSQVLYQTAQTLLFSAEQSDPMFVQECHSYMKWMEGNVALEHKDYTNAFLAYKESMMILYALLAHMTTSTDHSSMYRDQCCAVWKQRIDNILRPLVRYCQYEAKDDSLVLVENVTWLDSAIAAPSSSSIVIPFRGTDIVLDHDSYSQQITVLYLKLEPQLLLLRTNAPEILQDESTGLQVISDVDDIMTCVMDEIKTLARNAESVTPSVTRKRTQLMTLYSFLKYHKLSIWRRQQEQRIAATTSTHGSHESVHMGEILHLYTALQQIAVSMTDLAPPSDSIRDHVASAMDPAHGGDDDAGDDDDPYILEAQAHIVRVRAFRSYYLARYYEIMGHPAQYNDGHSVVQQYSLPLLQHAQILTKRATEEMTACNDEATLLLTPDLVDHYIRELEELNVQIKAMRCRIEATLYLQQFPLKADGTLSVTTSQGPMVDPERPLWLRFDEAEEVSDGTVLADEPPLPIPMPCKGVFYDIANQYLEDIIHNDLVPSLQDSVTASSDTASSTEAPSSHLGFLQWFRNNK